MLYDPKWEVETKSPVKPDVYALSTLIAWLEKQPTKKEYDFWDCDGACLISQYMTSCGMESLVWDEDRNSSKYTAFCNDTNFDDIAFPSPHTFGAALERARALL